MRDKLALICALAAIAFGIACVVQWQKLAEQKTQLVALREKLDATSRQLNNAQTAQTRSAKQSRELLRQLNDVAPMPQHSQFAAAPTNPPPDEEAAGLAKALTRWQNDPETKKTIRENQRLIMEPRYGPLIKQMGLTSEEADKLKDLIGDGKRKATLSFLSDDSATTNSIEALNRMVAAEKDLDEQVRQLLGDGRFSQYQDYKEMIGEREQLREFDSELSGNPLTDQQKEQLLAVMKEEKQNVGASTGLPVSGFAKVRSESDIADLSSLQPLLSKYSEEQLGELLFQAQQTVNQRVYDRAKTLLTPEQLESFGAYQTNKLEEMRPLSGNGRSPENP
jgi:hypothetical protein